LLLQPIKEALKYAEVVNLLFRSTAPKAANILSVDMSISAIE
jgi:hypothetical protein